MIAAVARSVHPAPATGLGHNLTITRTIVGDEMAMLKLLEMADDVRISIREHEGQLRKKE